MRRDRLAAAAGAVVCFGSVAYAIAWLQGQLLLDPCPLCVLARVAFIAAGVVFLVAAIHGAGPVGQRVYAVGALLPLLAGIGISGRHVWLQHLPADQVPACGPDLGYIVETFPLGRALEIILRGSGSCADIQWNFLGLTIPEWTLGLFLVLTGLALWLLVRPVRA